MRWLKGLARFFYRLAAWVGIILIVLAIIFTQTPWGRNKVLGEVLTRVEGRVHGDLVVRDISSSGLLRGFTFKDVEIRDEDGRPFLVADSIRAGVSPMAILRGDLVFTGVDLWRPRVTLERLPGEDEWNAVSIFLGDRQSDSTDSTEAAVPQGGDAGPAGSEIEAGDSVTAGDGMSDGDGGRIIALKGVQIVEGSLDILKPISAADRESGRMWVEPGPDGQPNMRRMSFLEMEIRLGEVSLRSPEESGERFELQHLSFVGQVWREPFRVVSAWGDLRRESNHFSADLESLDLPNSQTSGTIEVQWGETEGVVTDVQGEAEQLALEDIWAVDARLPQGVARGPFGLVIAPTGTWLDFRATELESSLGRIRAQGGLHLSSTLGFRDLDLELEGIDIAITDPWVEEPVPLRGWVDGTLALGGDLEDFELDGTFTLTDPDSVGSSLVEVAGLIHLRESLAATHFELIMAPLEWGTLASISPAMTLTGPGRLYFNATGSLESGMGIRVEATHVPVGRDPTRVAEDALISGDLTPTRVLLEGSVRGDSTEVWLGLSGDLMPLSLTTLRRSFPDLPLTGEYEGTVELNGPLSDLEVTTELLTSAGPVSLAARFDARRPEEHYTVEAEAEEFLLSALLPSLPEPTRLTGLATASGRGFSMDSIQGDAQVFLRHGNVGLFGLDTAAVVARIHEGTLQLDTVVIDAEVGRLWGGGSFGVASDAPSGELAFQVETESLEPLRPFLMEVPDVIVDTLRLADSAILIADGVNLDTLATLADIAVDGRVRGRVRLQGGLTDFSGEGSADFRELRFRSDAVKTGTVTFSAENLPGDLSRIEALIRADSISYRTLHFPEGEADLDFGRSNGRIALAVNRSATEGYRARGTFALDSIGGGVVNLDELALRFDSVRWNLGGPASFSWSPEGYRVRDFQLIRPGVDNMRVRADGLLPLQGNGDLEVEVRELNLGRVARAIQMETPMEGVMSLQAKVTGSPSDPRVVGSVAGQGLRYGDFSLSGLESEIDYLDQRLTLGLTATDGGRQVVSAQGFLPLDLRIGEAEDDTLPPGDEDPPPRQLDLTFALDSFPAAVALAFLETVEDVEGAFSGELYFGGTSRAIAPSGEISLTGGAAALPALGVRHEEVEALFTLTPDRVVEVDGSLRSVGSARVTGTVTLDSLSNPGLDLRVDVRDFLAVNRRDFQGRLSTEDSISIRGSYRRPRVTGDLKVEQGVMMVEEVARTAEVVDLTNSEFFTFVDTEQVTLRPIVQASQNPFLQNLLLDIDLLMIRDSWLRGKDLNLELAGGLQVTWDRMERNLTLFGDLEAIRGTYWVLGRQFQVQEGAVRFQGVPGINPDLEIEALNRLRTFDNQRLDVIATVEGNLLHPRVSLSSDSPITIAESDLVSYLIFGRPSYALASAQSSYAQGAAGSILGAAEEAGTQFIMGTVSAELGSVFAREAGLDYLAITQGADQTGSNVSPLGTTQVEIGQYLSEDVFASFLVRPLTGLGGSSQDRFAGLRVEWRLEDQVTLEGFWEDQFSRASLFRHVEIEFPKILGLSLFKDWVY